MLISSHYTLTDIFFGKIGNSIACGIKSDDAIHFFLRKKVTPGVASQPQAYGIAFSPHKGVLAVEGLEESAEALVGSGGGRSSSTLHGRHGGYGRSRRCSRVRSCRILGRGFGRGFGHRKFHSVGIVASIGIPGVEARLRQRAARLVVGMLHLLADGNSYCGIERSIPLLGIFGTDADEDLDAFTRDADESHHYPGQLFEEFLDFGRAAARMVEVDADEPAELLHVGHGMPAETDAGGNDAGHPVLHGLRLSFVSRQCPEAAVFFHCLLEAVAAQLFNK